MKFTTTDGTVTDTQYIKTMSIDKTMGAPCMFPVHLHFQQHPIHTERGIDV